MASAQKKKKDDLHWTEQSLDLNPVGKSVKGHEKCRAREMSLEYVKCATFLQRRGK